MSEETKKESVTEQVMKDTVARARQNEQKLVAVGATDTARTMGITRNILLVGCGDGGCNIASAIRTSIPETYAIAYNTSQRAIDNIEADVKIVPADKDGAGKDRRYSQDILRNGVYKHLMEHVQATADKMPGLEYILVTTTADGGTGGGMSPMVAKLLADNMEVPVIVLGVYPDIHEDAQSQVNAMTWEDEIEKIGVPHILLDNSIPNMTKMDIHELVNNTAVAIAKVLSGVPFGETNISGIDNRDMQMLLSQIGRRITVYSTTSKPTIGQSMDSFLEGLIDRSPQPKPEGVRGIGLFLKGPEDFLHSADTTLQSFRSKYGDALVQYNHLEESDEVTIALICSGCNPPSDRIMMMRRRYDDINNAVQNIMSQTSKALDGITSPLGQPTKKTRSKDTDLSALNL